MMTTTSVVVTMMEELIEIEKKVHLSILRGNGLTEMPNAMKVMSKMTLTAVLVRDMAT